MVDYTKETGNGGTMLIRDRGTAVEFHIQAGLSATFVGSPGFGTSAYVNGAWRSLANVANYSNREWQLLGSYNVTTDQTVIFHIDASGTEGFGGPTDFHQAINRATVPPAPTNLGIDQIGHTTVRQRFQNTGDGGSKVLEWQIGYGYSPTSVQYTMASGGTSTIKGLDIGRTMYSWARGRNAVGWGPWSARSSARTLSSGRIKVAGVWQEYVLYIKVAGVWRQAIPYSKVAGIWRAMTGNT